MTDVGNNPYPLLHRAARGDLEAQRQLAESALQLGLCNSDFTALFEGLVFARLAACQGDLRDHGRLLSMLALAGDSCTADEQDLNDALNGEALARVSILADAGVPDTDTATNALAETGTAQSLQYSKRHRAALLAATEGTGQ